MCIRGPRSSRARVSSKPLSEPLADLFADANRATVVHAHRPDHADPSRPTGPEWSADDSQVRSVTDILADTHARSAGRLAADRLKVTVSLEKIEHAMHDRQVGPEFGQLTRPPDEQFRARAFSALDLVVYRVDDPSHEIRQVRAGEQLVRTRLVAIPALVYPFDDAFGLIELVCGRFEPDGDDLLGHLTGLSDRHNEDGTTAEAVVPSSL